VHSAIASQRLDHQRITRPGRGGPEEVVAWLGAVQAQEYAAARWGLALRMSRSPTDAEIERACDDGRILRTHVLRPTWHFVGTADIRWMLELTAPRVHQAMSSYTRRLGLDSALLTRAATVFERALGRGPCLTRSELGSELARAGIAAKGIVLALITIYAELEGVICSGPRRNKQLTYALLADRASFKLQLTGNQTPRKRLIEDLNGDKDATLTYLWHLAMQHGGLWVSLAIKPANVKASRRDDPNRMGSYIAPMAQSDADAPPEEMSAGDLETARLYGARIAEIAGRFAPVANA